MTGEMHDIEMHEVSEEFVRCWQAAGRHIQRRIQGDVSWLKANLNPPFLEHLSFRLGNQLFFIRLEDDADEISVPGSRRGLMMIADGCNGHGCLMPMQRRAGEWTPARPGWGFLDLRTGRTLDPVSLVSDELTEMTDWELQDFAVQVVRDHLLNQNREIMSWQGNPSVDPSIWFVGDQGPEWVVVRSVRYPRKSGEWPENWRTITESCSRLGNVGHFASVSVANADDAFDLAGKVPPMPLWRGHGMLVSFAGLARLPS
jgi:hypothetical protein